MNFIRVVILLTLIVNCHSVHENDDLEKRFSNLEKLVHVQSEYIRKLELDLKIRDLKFKGIVSAQSEEIAKLKQEVAQSLDHANDKSKEKRLLEGSFLTTAFYAYFSNSISDPGKGHVLVFDTVKVNINNGYSANTGVFHVPVSGTYVFTFSFRIVSGHYGSFEIVRNGNPEGAAIGILPPVVGTSDQEQVLDTILVTASQGDEVYVRTHSTLYHNGTILSNTHGRSMFAGWMISRL